MVKSYDGGSMPFTGDFRKFFEGATSYGSIEKDSTIYFEKKVVEAFLDKAEAGIDIPNYPQFRDMNEMLLEMIKGVNKTQEGYMETDVLSLKNGGSRIPEVMTIKRRAKEIHERVGDYFMVKVCIVGPYTLSSLFKYKTKGTIQRLGKVISQIAENSIFDGKYGGVGLISVDEPIFGMLDDPLLDRGSEGREYLRKTWESIFKKASSRGVETGLHLHSTVDELFWEIKSLNVIESHTRDSLYQQGKVRELLEQTDKFLKASISINDFDRLIQAKIEFFNRFKKIDKLSMNEKIAEVWRSIYNGESDPKSFLEEVELMKKRLVQIIDRFGAERVPYAGPECGLKGFPNYDCALEGLRRVSKAVKTI